MPINNIITINDSDSGAKLENLSDSELICLNEQFDNGQISGTILTLKNGQLCRRNWYIKEAPCKTMQS